LQTPKKNLPAAVPGCVVLYNPGRQVLANIASYIGYLDVLYVVDNSDDPDLAILAAVRKLPRVRYVSMGGNQGIAAALNRASSLALSHGYAWLMCFDQDTWITENIFLKLFQCLDNYDKDGVGIICARYSHKDRYVEVSGVACSELMVAITAGSLINLSVYEKIGPFMEKLFIDHVDHEYCLRLRRQGYKIVQKNDAVIGHQMGSRKKNLFCYSSNHGPFRRYFMTRNRFYVAKMYKNDLPRFHRTEMVRFAGELVKILLFEQEKFKKFKNIAKGYLDYRKERFDRDLKEL
jgi:rhamnosyltransferase